MLDGILDNLGIALLVRRGSEALDASDCVVDEIVYQILIRDLLLVDYLRCESDDDLRVIDEAGLHDLGKLRDQRFLFEKQVVRTFFGVDEDSTHGLEQIVEDLLEVCRLVQLLGGGKDVTIEDLQEKLHIASRKTQD
jgi:hypothetical protein